MGTKFLSILITMPLCGANNLKLKYIYLKYFNFMAVPLKLLIEKPSSKKYFVKRGTIARLFQITINGERKHRKTNSMSDMIPKQHFKDI